MGFLVTGTDMRAGHNGVELAACFRILRPETRIVLTSGRREGTTSVVNGTEDEIQSLTEPFTKEMVMDAIVHPARSASKAVQAV